MPSGVWSHFHFCHDVAFCVFDVVLSAFDAKAKIKIIKEVRSITGAGLKDAKSMVENLPSTLKEGVSKDAAEEIKKKIEGVGGKIEIK